MKLWINAKSCGPEVCVSSLSWASLVNMVSYTCSWNDTSCLVLHPHFLCPQRSGCNILWTGPLGDEDVGEAVRFAGELGSDAAHCVGLVSCIALVLITLSWDNSLSVGQTFSARTLQNWFRGFHRRAIVPAVLCQRMLQIKGFRLLCVALSSYAACKGTGAN